MTNEETTVKEEKRPFEFRLYVTGASPNSSRAIANLKNLLDGCVRGRYRLRVIDVYQQPHITKSVDIIALPLLVREFPLPKKRVIGDLSDQARVVQWMELNEDQESKIK